MSDTVLDHTSSVLAKPTRSYAHLSPETVLDVHHWTDRLFSFTTTRDMGFRFENGQFAMIGLELDGRPLLRAYSIASANYEERLEFLSISVPDGPLTSRLCKVRPGDVVLVGRKPTGTLLADNLRPGRTLYLLATGTGLAPFLALIKDPAVYERFDRVVLAHGVRVSGELAYANHIRHELPRHEFLGEDVAAKLLYYPTVTREAYQTTGRLTDLIETGRMFADLGLPPLDPAHDRVMICGSEAMLAELEAMLERRGFDEGSSNSPGAYVVEKAFAQK